MKGEKAHCVTSSTLTTECVYVLTFQFIVIERPILFHTVLNTMWLYTVSTAGFVLEHHLDGILFFSSQHRTCDMDAHKHIQTIGFNFNGR